MSIKDYHGDYINLDTEYIPYQKLIFNPEKYLNKRKTYYFYCKKGVKSKYVVEELLKKGYKAIRLV